MTEEESLSAGAVCALARHQKVDPDHTSVHALDDLLSMLMAFGATSRAKHLGHPKVLELVDVYVSKFACPSTCPLEFGLCRAFRGRCVGLGQGKFDEAISIADEALAALAALATPSSAADEARKRLTRMRLSATQGTEHPWFRSYPPPLA